MTDAEIRDRLQFTPPWFALGVVDDAWVGGAVEVFRESDDQGDEHYRYGAFVAFFRRRKPALLAGECRALFELAAGDPDAEMGTSMILDLLDAPGCPDDVWDAAARHPPSARYVPVNWRELRQSAPDPEARRRELQALGPEGYYRAYRRRADGRPQRWGKLWHEMRDLFGIDKARFREIEDAAERPAE